MPNAIHRRFSSYSFDQHDFPSHMLGLSSPRPRFRNWFFIAVAAGTLLALALLAISSLIF
jgi:hypothetical protein